MTIKLLVLFEYATRNGGENSFLSLLPAIRAAGFDVIAGVPPGGQLADALRAEGVACEAFDAATRQYSQAQRRDRLGRLLSRVAPQLVHANSLAMSRLSGPVVSARRVASVGHVRDIMRVSAQAMRDVNRHTRLLAVSEATRQWHGAEGLDLDRTHVLYNGVDVGRFAARPRTRSLPDELGIPEDSELIGGVGQLGARKGWDLLLDAFLAIAHDFPKTHVVLAGQRLADKSEAVQFVENLEQRARHEAISGRVHFLGRREDIANLLPQLTLLVHPARQEPLGRVLLEAAACTVPVVATRVGGTEEIFPPSAQAAVLVEPDSAEALSSAVRYLLGAPGRRSALGINARRRILERFDAKSVGLELVRHYRQILG